MVLDYQSMCASVLSEEWQNWEELFTDCWDAVKEAKDRAKDFTPKLRDLEKSLQRLVPVVEDIERINTELNESNESDIDDLKSIMQEGKELASKCIGVSWWNFIKKSYYQKKLVDLENKIIRFINIHIQLSTFREVKHLRLQVNDLESIQRRRSQIGARAQCKYASMSPAGSFPSASAWPSIFSTSICNELVDFSFLDLSYPRPFAPPQVPKAPTIGIFGLIFLLFLPSEAEILKVIAIIFIIMSMLEKSEGGIWMVIKDVGVPKTTTEQLKATMKSLVYVLEEIETDSEQLLMNETDRIQALESLRSLMKEGEKLASESSYDMVWWNFVKKWQYQKRMAELDNKCLRIRSLYLRARLAKNIEEIGHGTPRTPQPSLKIDTSLTSPPKPAVLSSDKEKGLGAESSRTIGFLADELDGELDGDEFDGDELDGDELDGDELDDDEFQFSHQTQRCMRKEQIQPNLMMNWMMTNSYSLKRMMKAVKQQLNATTQQLEATTQLVNRQAEIMKQMQEQL